MENWVVLFPCNNRTHYSYKGLHRVSDWICSRGKTKKNENTRICRWLQSNEEIISTVIRLTWPSLSECVCLCACVWEREREYWQAGSSLRNTRWRRVCRAAGLPLWRFTQCVCVCMCVCVCECVCVVVLALTLWNGSTPGSQASLFCPNCWVDTLFLYGQVHSAQPWLCYSLQRDGSSELCGQVGDEGEEIPW